ncbi:MAG: UDP-N-acetylmuramoyl-L-alanine--D-glutamate ligase [Planctomycetota bacterium]
MSPRRSYRTERAHADLSGARVTVMGLGLFGGGATAARYLARQGAHVTVTDQRTAEELAPARAALADLDLRFVLGGHDVADFTNADVVVANPAVDPRSPFLTAARAAGVRISSETALFLERCPARIAAVTGTQGKSSTCHTLHQLLVAAGMPAYLGGNIGHSLLDGAETMRSDDIVVLEISSYQLDALSDEWIDEVRPRIEVATVTNVLADHLERHGTIDAYAAAKRRLLDLTRVHGGRIVLSGEDARLSTWRDESLARIDVFVGRPSECGLNLRAGRFWLEGEELGRVDDVRLPGWFQRENTLYALGMARLLGADATRLARALPDVRALPHRLEDLGLHAGHRVWDNGVSTTPDSTVAALLSLAPGCTLVCGGKAKNLPLDELVAVARSRARHVVTFGAAADGLASAFRSGGVDVHAAPTLDDAVALAFEHLREDEELLFSPACASFDAYLNFKERAHAFRRALPASAPARIRER